jgi:hypothetical protein
MESQILGEDWQNWVQQSGAGQHHPGKGPVAAGLSGLLHELANGETLIETHDAAAAGIPDLIQAEGSPGAKSGGGKRASSSGSHWSTHPRTTPRNKARSRPSRGWPPECRRSQAAPALRRPAPAARNSTAGGRGEPSRRGVQIDQDLVDSGPAADLEPDLEHRYPANGYQTLRNLVRQRPQAGAAAQRNAFTQSSSSFERYWDGGTPSKELARRARARQRKSSACQRARRRR